MKWQANNEVLRVTRYVRSRILRQFAEGIPTDPVKVRRVMRHSFGLAVHADHVRPMLDSGFIASGYLERFGEAIEGAILYNPYLCASRQRRALIHELAEYLAYCLMPPLPLDGEVRRIYATGESDPNDFYHQIARRVEDRLCGRRR